MQVGYVNVLLPKQVFWDEYIEAMSAIEFNQSTPLYVASGLLTYMNASGAAVTGVPSLLYNSRTDCKSGIAPHPNGRIALYSPGSRRVAACGAVCSCQLFVSLTTLKANQDGVQICGSYSVDHALRQADLTLDIIPGTQSLHSQSTNVSFSILLDGCSGADQSSTSIRASVTGAEWDATIVTRLRNRGVCSGVFHKESVLADSELEGTHILSLFLTC